MDDEIEIPCLAVDGSISADWLAMFLSDAARVEGGKLQNVEYLAVAIATASDEILARATKAERERDEARAELARETAGFLPYAEKIERERDEARALLHGSSARRWAKTERIEPPNETPIPGRVFTGFALGTVLTAPFDDFTGEVIGHYQTRNGKRGVVLQQIGTRVVHVYQEKHWLRERDEARTQFAGALAREAESQARHDARVEAVETELRNKRAAIDAFDNLVRQFDGDLAVGDDYTCCDEARALLHGSGDGPFVATGAMQESAEFQREAIRLRAENARLREALMPFAKAGELFPERHPDGFDMLIYAPAAGPAYNIAAEDLRRARDALNPEKPNGD